MTEYTQDSIDKMLHSAIKNEDLNQVQYLLTSPELSYHADINSLNKYDQPVWGYLSRTSQEVEDYILHFQYIKEPKVKSATINNFLIGLSALYREYPVQKIVEYHKDILDSATLNNAFLNATCHHSIEIVPVLLSQNFPNHIWQIEEALILALIYGGKDTKMPNTIMNYNSNTLLKGLQDNNSSKWLENLLIQGNISFDIQKHLAGLIEHIGQTGSINLLNYFTHENKYQVVLEIDNKIFKSAIINHQYNLIEELIIHHRCRVDDEIEKYINQYETLRKNHTLEKISKLQEAIIFKEQLEVDLPVNNKVRTKSKI